MKRPKVFISYSWDSVEGSGHEDWVLHLAEGLNANGVDVLLDKWVNKPGSSLTEFMEKAATESDFIVVVCTPAFAKRSDSRAGAAGYEQQIVSGQILAGAPRTKFIPILRKGSASIGADHAIPTHFLGTIFLDFRHDETFEAKLEELVRSVFEVPKLVQPVIAPPPNYVTKEIARAHLQRPAEITIEVSGDLQLKDGPKGAKKTIDAARAYLKVGKSVIFKAHCEEYNKTIVGYEELDNLLQLGTISPDELVEMLDLKSKLLHANLLADWGHRTFSRIAEFQLAIETIVGLPELFKQWFSNEDLADAWWHYTKQESATYEDLNGSRFDIFPPSQAHSCVITLTPEETSSLEDSEGVPKGYMTGQWGLTLSLLPPKIVVQRAIPAMIREFVRHGRWTTQQMDRDTFFETYPWRMGIH